MATRSARYVARAFTLIELLVVVAIIALLISILLPSLAAARDQAKSAVCLTRLKNLILAEKGYENEYRGFIPGSPLTTGYHLATSPGFWEPQGPVNTFDYAIPLLKQMGQRLPQGQQNRESYYKYTTSGPMQCPANNQMAPRWNDPSPMYVIQAVSYLTMNTLVRGGDNEYKRWNSNPPVPLVSGVSGWDMGQPDPGSVVTVPRDYFPRLERLGRPDLKVFLADGLRYAVSDTYIDYGERPSDFGGYSSAEPPSDYQNKNGALCRDYTIGKKFSYRHRNGTGINVVMFDGHAEAFKAIWNTKDAKKATGSAVHPKYYYPSKSTVTGYTNLWMKDEYGAMLRAGKIPPLP